MVLQTLAAMGSLHGYGIARRIEQVSGDEVLLNQGTIYASLVRLQQRGWIAAEWGTSDNNRKAKFYAITAGGRRQRGQGHRLLATASLWRWARVQAGSDVEQEPHDRQRLTKPATASRLGVSSPGAVSTPSWTPSWPPVPAAIDDIMSHGISPRRSSPSALIHFGGSSRQRSINAKPGAS